MISALWKFPDCFPRYLAVCKDPMLFSLVPNLLFFSLVLNLLFFSLVPNLLIGHALCHTCRLALLRSRSGDRERVARNEELHFLTRAQSPDWARIVSHLPLVPNLLISHSCPISRLGTHCVILADSRCYVPDREIGNEWPGTRNFILYCLVLFRFNFPPRAQSPDWARNVSYYAAPQN